MEKNKIVIRNGRDGTTVSDGEGNELYIIDKAGDLVLFIEGLTTELPDVELIFHSNPARGAIFDLGKAAGRNLLFDANRFEVICTMGGVDTYIKHGKFSDMIMVAKEDTANFDIDNCILVDTKDRIVELVKGNIDPFKQKLNQKFSVWKIGKITRE